MNRNNLYRILHRLAPRVGAIAILSVACIAAACSSPERIRHSAIHFWDTTDMAGEDFAADAEERFVDFLELLQSDALNADERGVLLRKCFERAEADGRAFGTVCGLAEKYLDSFESPLYDEELYIHAIEAMIASRHITGHERLRPRYMWNMAQRNTSKIKNYCISKRTVDKHRANILEKTGCKNTASLVVYAIKNRIVEV